MIVEMARRPLPAAPPGGVCMVDIDAVTHGHLAAAERGRVGERYILGGENLTYSADYCDHLRVVGRRVPALEHSRLGHCRPRRLRSTWLTGLSAARSPAATSSAYPRTMLFSTPAKPWPSSDIPMLPFPWRGRSGPTVWYV